MTPIQIGEEWFVAIGEERVAGPFKQNVDAWRWIDGNDFTKTRTAKQTLSFKWVRRAAGELLKGKLVHGYDRRFVSDLMKAANQARTDLLVSGADASRWRRLAGRLNRAGQKPQQNDSK